MLRTHWLDQPSNLRWLWRLFLAALIATVFIEPFVGLHPHFEVENLFGFYAWFGLLSCIAMIVVSKGLALLLKRPDRYYDVSDDDARHD